MSYGTETKIMADFVNGRTVRAHGEAHARSGIYPENEAGLRSFAKVYYEAMKGLNRPTDIMAVIRPETEERHTISKTMPLVQKTRMRALEPFYFKASDEAGGPGPWSSELEGRNVLLIHRMIESIKCQLRPSRRKHIFPGTDVLPPFKRTFYVKAFQARAGETPHNSWAETLMATYQVIDRTLTE